MKKVALLALCILAMTACAYRGMPQSSPSMQYMGTQQDGSITLRVSTYGRNYADALKLAEKYALRQVIFYGVPAADNTIISKPLVTEVNAEEKYQNFFNAFFSDGGDYSRFTSSEDRRAGSNYRSTGKVTVHVVSTIRVLRSDLKQYLLENNIIIP